MAGLHATFVDRPGIPYIGPEHGLWIYPLDYGSGTIILQRFELENI